MSTNFPSSLQQRLRVGSNVMMPDTLRQGKYQSGSMAYHTHPSMPRLPAAKGALKTNRPRNGLCPLSQGSALFLAVHIPSRFATKQMDFGVVLAHHGLSERRTSPEMMARCVFGGLYPRSGLARHSQGGYPGVSQPVVTRVP